MTYIVELNLLACSCQRWQLTGIPCSHSIACLRSERIKPDQMVNNCYSLNSYMQAYGANIMPLRDQTEWQQVNGPTVLPPSYEKKVGRPPKSRRKAPEEKADGTKLSKHGVTIHCGYCRRPNRNRIGCPRLKAIAQAKAVAQRHAQGQPQVDEQEQAEGAAQEHAQGDETQPAARRRRKRRRTVHRQVDMSSLNINRGPTTVDENGDADIPEILQHIEEVQLDPRLDPLNVRSSMVSQLGQQAPTFQIEEDTPIPTKCAFVAANRSSIPAARVTTVTTEGAVALRGRGRNRSGGRRVAATAAAVVNVAAIYASTSTTRGRGAGARGRGRGAGARGRGAGARGIGAAARGWENLLFGPTEMNTTQSAPFDMSQE
uniref:SWIM-type domain-containing protein n=1 Tax=Triticum urartu TaxID=4572 RepID=A0A8R7QPE3_TRIUA